MTGSAGSRSDVRWERRRRRRRQVAVALGLAVLAALVVTVYFALRDAPPPVPAARTATLSLPATGDARPAVPAAAR